MRHDDGYHGTARLLRRLRRLSRPSVILIPLTVAVLLLTPLSPRPLLFTIYADQHGTCVRAVVQTTSGPALNCSPPGAACDGGAGKCVNKSVKTGGTPPNRCKCAIKGKGSSVSAKAPVSDLVAFFNNAEIGQAVTLEFTGEKLLGEETFFFHPGLFDARPNLLNVSLTMEVIGRPGGLVHVRIAGDLVRESFDVVGIGPTGLNHESIAAGVVLVNTQLGVFEGLFTVVLVNDIWTADNPIVMVEGINATFNALTDTMTFTTGAPDESFVVPTACLNLSPSQVRAVQRARVNTLPTCG